MCNKRFLILYSFMHKVRKQTGHQLTQLCSQSRETYVRLSTKEPILAVAAIHVFSKIF